MKALQVTAHGRPGEVLAVREIDRPEPEAGEVRVKVAAASLNFNDIDRCRGNLVSVPTPPPFTLGMDVCGIVDAAGEGAEPWLGKRVVARAFVPSSGLPVGNIHFRRWAQMTFHNPDHVDQLHRRRSDCRYYQRPPQRRL